MYDSSDVDVRDQEAKELLQVLVEEVRLLREQTTALLETMLRKDGEHRAHAVRMRSRRKAALCWTAMLRALVCFVIAVAVAAGLALTASGAPVARCQPTVSDTPGPFQQSGVNAPRRAKIGTGHVLQGRVVRAPDCAPVARALVVLWQAGPNGYRPNGRGSVLTDRAGRFRFEGPVPANYGRLPHIHIAVFHPEYEELLSRYVVRRSAKTGRIRLVLTPLL